MCCHIKECFSMFFWKPHCIKFISLLRMQMGCINNQADLDMKT